MSILSAGPASGGAGPGFGERIFAWNKADLLQFDTGALLTFEETLGGGPSGTMVPSYVADAYKGDPVIRLTCTSILGGSVLAIKSSELTLPKRFVMFVHLVGIDTASLSAIMCPFGNADGSQWRGLVAKRTSGSSTLDMEITTDATGTQRLRTPTAVNPTCDTWNATVEDRGGSLIRFDCLRQAGGATPDYFVRVIAQEPSNYDAGSTGAADATGGNDPSPDWDSEDLDRCGIGALSETSGRSGVIDVLDLQVFAAS